MDRYTQVAKPLEICYNRTKCYKSEYGKVLRIYLGDQDGYQSWNISQDPTGKDNWYGKKEGPSTLMT